MGRWGRVIPLVGVLFLFGCGGSPPVAPGTVAREDPCRERGHGGRELLRGRDRDELRFRLDLDVRGVQEQEALEVAVAIEDDHGMVAAREAIQLVSIIHRYRRDFVKRPTVGQFAEILDHLVAELAAA